MPRTLDGAVVAVVGTGGLGRALATALAAHGATVVVAGRSGAVDVRVDLTDADAGAALVEHVTRTHGRLDGVVIAAGVVAFGELADTEDVVVEELLLTNAMGPLWLAKRVMPALRESRGFLVNISGMVAATPMPGMAAYSASKAAAAAGLVCDVQPPHTETGLATRPLAGTAPRLPQGLEPEAVAERIVAAIEADQPLVSSTDFG